MFLWFWTLSPQFDDLSLFGGFKVDLKLCIIIINIIIIIIFVCSLGAFLFSD